MADSADIKREEGREALLERVYSPESALSDPARLIREMWRDLRDSRELAWRLFVRDLKGQYRQSVLGYLWVFFPPLVTTVTFVFLNSQDIISLRETPIVYPAFVMISTLLWQNFVDALNSPLKKVSANRAMLVKINLPHEALILAGLGEVLFNFSIRLVLLLPVFVIYQIPVSSSLLLFPLGVAGLTLFGLLIGIILTPFGILFNDVERGLVMITGFWMLLTPVVYPQSTEGVAGFLTRWNPVSPVLITTRDWLTGLPPVHLQGFLLVSLFSIVFLLFGWIFYRVSLPHLISRLGM